MAMAGCGAEVLLLCRGMETPAEKSAAGTRDSKPTAKVVASLSTLYFAIIFLEIVLQVGLPCKSYDENRRTDLNLSRV